MPEHPRHQRSGSRDRARPLLGTAGVAVAVLVGVAAISGLLGGTPGSGERTSADAGPTASAGPAGSPALTPTGPVVTPTGSAPGRSASAASRGLTDADRAAGLRSRVVPSRGTGRLAVVKGDRAAPGPGPEIQVRVEVERGLDVDRQAFARFVLATLNDERSWAHDGARSFARTDGKATLRVVLASPRTSEALCRPLVTYGRLSCRSGDAAVLTLHRWVTAIPEYRGNRAGYRRYVVNHEVGHLLGYGHQPCPGTGRRAPLMMQQTKGLLGCRPNPWPHP